jgi:hypothetical protein
MFWADHPDHIVVYHGTHTRNIPHILKNGLSNKDPKTGMVSVTFGDHGKSVAHGYAAMSGEHNFRQAGAKAETVPDEHRSIVVAHLPMDWVHQHVDRNFGGNSPEIKQRLQNRELHNKFVEKNGTDFHPHETPELRFKEAIPAKYIVDVTQKRKPMKTFKEFVEEEVTTNSMSGGGTPKIAAYDKLLNFARRFKNFPYKDKFNHPETTVELQKKSSSGIAGLP